MVHASRAAAISACFLLVPVAGGLHQVADGDRGDEVLVVVGTGLGDGVDGRRGAATGGDLLQARLRVHRGAEALGVGEERPDQSQHERRGRIAAGVEVDRADDRLDRVGEDRRLVGAAGQLSPRPSRT